MIRQGQNRLQVLDLHGYREAEAIRTLTDFLDRVRVGTVKVITGTGSHSHDGPVLRIAIEKQLKKRRMKYTMDTPGSFCMDCASGIRFYRQASTDEDTKVVTTTHDSEEASIYFASKQKPSSGSASLQNCNDIRRDSLASTVDSSSRSLSTNDLGVGIGFGPSVQEVHLEEQAMELAMRDSLKESRNIDREKRLFERAIQNSLTEEKEEEEMLKEIMALSKKESQREFKVREREEKLFETALKESENLVQREIADQEREDRLLQQALEESKLFSKKDIAEQRKEERLLRKALANSQRQFVISDEAKQEKDDEIIQQSMEESEVSEQSSTRQQSMEESEVSEQSLTRDVVENQGKDKDLAEIAADLRLGS